MKFRLYLFFAILLFYSVSGMLSSMIIPAQERNIRLIIVACDAAMIGLALLNLWKHRGFFGVWALLAFLFFSSLTLVYTSDRFGVVEHLNGLRDPLYFFAALIVVYDLYTSKHHDLFVRGFTVFLIPYAIVQTPVAIIQFLQYGAGDGVGGTYGTAGGSGYLSQLLFLITFYLVVRYASLPDGSHFRISRVPLFLALLIPCAINETKVSFILLGLFILLLAGSRRRILRTIPLLALGFVLIYLMDFYYTTTVEDTTNIFDTQFFERYLLTNPTETGGDLPRFQRFFLMFRVMGGDIGSILLGMGYGVLGGGNIMGVSRLGRSLYYLVSGSRILLFRVWIQGGLLVVLTMGFAMFAWMRARAYQYPTVRKLHYFLAFSILLSWVYNEAMLDRTFAPIVSFLMLWVSYAGGPGEEEELADDTAAEELADAES